MHKWDEPAFRRVHRRKTAGRLDEWSELHRIREAFWWLWRVTLYVLSTSSTVWSSKRLAGVPLGGGQGLPGRPPSSRPHWVAAVVRVTEATLVRAVTSGKRG